MQCFVGMVIIGPRLQSSLHYRIVSIRLYWIVEGEGGSVGRKTRTIRSIPHHPSPSQTWNMVTKRWDILKFIRMDRWRPVFVLVLEDEATRSQSPDVACERMYLCDRRGRRGPYAMARHLSFAPSQIVWTFNYWIWVVSGTFLGQVGRSPHWLFYWEKWWPNARWSAVIQTVNYNSWNSSTRANFETGANCWKYASGDLILERDDRSHLNCLTAAWFVLFWCNCNWWD